jgi:hypothetical protein
MPSGAKANWKKLNGESAVLTVKLRDTVSPGEK